MYSACTSKRDRGVLRWHGVVYVDKPEGALRKGGLDWLRAGWLRRMDSEARGFYGADAECDLEVEGGGWRSWMKMCVILGTRPEIIKMSPVVRACERQEGSDWFVLHTRAGAFL